MAPGTGTNIYSMETDGSRLAQITHGPGVSYSPWFSPDGRSIVFVAASPEGAGCHICVMDIAGNQIRQLTFGADVDSTPSYSRDGTKIIFARSVRSRPYSMGGRVSDQWDVWEMNADGSSPRQLTFERYYTIDPPYFSPDGKHVLFGACPAYDPLQKTSIMDCLFTFDILPGGSAGNLRPLPLTASKPDMAYDGDPCYSPDGSSVAFASLRSSRPSPFDYEIWMAEIGGTGLRPITQNRSRSLYPVFSPDGKLIYYEVPGGIGRIGSDGVGAKTLFSSPFLY